MLTRTTRKEFNEHIWEKIAKKSKNLTSKVRRCITQSNTAINDLILFANKLPNDLQKDIFYPKNIERFIQAILKGNDRGLHTHNEKTIFKGEDAEHDKDFNNKKLELALSIVTKGIQRFLDNYKEPRQVALSDSDIEILNKAIGICYRMAYPYRVEKRSIPIRYNLKKKKEAID